MKASRLFIYALCTALWLTAPLVSALPANAQQGVAVDVADTAKRFLRSQGYEIVREERTFLGRVRIEALKDGMLRELVFDRGSGELLRDRVEPAPAGRRSTGAKSIGESLTDLFNSWGGAAPGTPPVTDDKPLKDLQGDD